MAPKRRPGLDRIDLRILSTLQRHGRWTNQRLAQTVGLSPRACLERVRRLEAAGIIAGYPAKRRTGRSVTWLMIRATPRLGSSISRLVSAS